MGSKRLDDTKCTTDLRQHVLQGLGSGAEGRGFWVGVESVGFRVLVLRVRIQGSGFRIQVSRFKVHGSWFRVQGSGFRV